MRYGSMFGPNITFLGIPECDVDEVNSYKDADVVIIGAPFDGGTSYRSGARLGPSTIRGTDYLPHDGSRPHLATRMDGLKDIVVKDAGRVTKRPVVGWREWLREFFVVGLGLWIGAAGGLLLGVLVLGAF